MILLSWNTMPEYLGGLDSVILKFSTCIANTPSMEILQDPKSPSACILKAVYNPSPFFACGLRRPSFQDMESYRRGSSGVLAMEKQRICGRHTPPAPPHALVPGCLDLGKVSFLSSNGRICIRNIALNTVN
jgi:hypothetical protein